MSMAIGTCSVPARQSKILRIETGTNRPESRLWGEKKEEELAGPIR